MTATERWIVHFAASQLDLRPLHRALETRDPGAPALVADMARAAEAERAELRRELAALGGELVETFWLIPAASVTVPEGRGETLTRLPGVTRAERDRRLAPAAGAPRIRTSTDLAHHAADALQARGLFGQGATVAILDSGQAAVSPASGPCPLANPAPPLPDPRLALPLRLQAVEVTAATDLTIQGFDLWGYDPAEATLSTALYLDNGGKPADQPVATGTLKLLRLAGFGTTSFAAPVQVQKGQRCYLAFQPANTSLRCVMPDGDASTVWSRTAAGWTPSPVIVAWRARCVGLAPPRPHRTYFRDGDLAKEPRLAVNRQVGALGAHALPEHGTAVASIAAGGAWATPLADHGHAPAARIAGYAVADDASGQALMSTVVKAWQKAVCDGVWYGTKVACFAYDGSPDPLAADQMALDAAAYWGDLLVATAAGNGGQSTQQSQISVNGISVGAAAADKTVLASSSRGLVAGQLFPDLVAHGASVVMAKAGDEAADLVATGTSFAAAQVAGAAALLRGRFGALSAVETKAILLAAAQASPGSGATQVATGPGCGYLRDDLAFDTAADPARHGAVVLTPSAPVFEAELPAVQGNDYQVAIAWQRSDVTKAVWSRVELRVKDGTGATVAVSAAAQNTEQMVRFRAARSESHRIEVRLAAAREPVVKVAWATSAPTGGGLRAARYSEFNTGCKGTGAGGGCPKLKQDPRDVSVCPPLPPKTTYAMLVQCPCTLEVMGFSLYCASSQPSTPVQCWLYKSSPSTFWPQVTPAASGTMIVGTTPAAYTVTFTSAVILSLAEAENFYIAFTTPDTEQIWARHLTVQHGHHFLRAEPWGAWQGGGGGLHGSFNDTAWDWNVTCLPGNDCPGGPELCLSSVGRPITGDASFALRVDDARPQTVAVLLTGAPGQCVAIGRAAPSCWLCVVPILTSGVLTDAHGSATVKFPVPSLPGLSGVSFQQQFVALDARANQLGLTFSDYGLGVVGTR